MGNGNRPTPEFRREAVRLALTSSRTRREIAADLGIGLSTLTRWLKEERDAVILPVLTGRDRRTHAAIFSFMAGVTPPMPMLGRSLL